MSYEVIKIYNYWPLRLRTLPFYDMAETTKKIATDAELTALRARIDAERLPKHVAVIMDGNGRWAQSHGQPRVFGHRNGVKAVDQTTETVEATTGGED